MREVKCSSCGKKHRIIRHYDAGGLEVRFELEPIESIYDRVLKAQHAREDNDFNATRVYLGRKEMKELKEWAYDVCRFTCAPFTKGPRYDVLLGMRVVPVMEDEYLSLGD